MRDYKKIEVWQLAHELVISIYRVTRSFPREELFGLTSQLRRAAVSVPANIAEGFKKKSRLDKLRFFNIAQGSLEEVRYYLLLAKDLGYGDSSALADDLDIVGKLLEGYMSSIKRSM